MTGPVSRLPVSFPAAFAHPCSHTGLGTDGEFAFGMSPADAEELLDHVRKSAYLASYGKVPENELRQRVYAVYSHLSQWLLSSPEAENRAPVFRDWRAPFPARSAPERASVDHRADERQSWEFLSKGSWPGFEAEVLAEHKMFRSIDQFFNRAMHHAAIGFEAAERAERVPSCSCELALGFMFPRNTIGVRCDVRVFLIPSTISAK